MHVKLFNAPRSTSTSQLRVQRGRKPSETRKALSPWRHCRIWVFAPALAHGALLHDVLAVRLQHHCAARTGRGQGIGSEVGLGSRLNPTSSAALRRPYEPRSGCRVGTRVKVRAKPYPFIGISPPIQAVVKVKLGLASCPTAVMRRP